MSKLRAVLVVAGIAVAPVGDAAAPTNLKVMMRDKLESAHMLLEGMVMEDYAKIEAAATKLHNISTVTEWHRPEDPDFQHHAKSFQNAAAALLEAAKKKNLEGVSFGQVRITLECMQCHNFVRAGRPRK